MIVNTLYPKTRNNMKRFILMFASILIVTSLSASPIGDECMPDTLQNNSFVNNFQQKQTTFSVQLEGNILRTQDVPDGSILSIYAITGMKIGSYKVQDNEVVLNNTPAKGIYIIRVNNKATKITVR